MGIKLFALIFFFTFLKIFEGFTFSSNLDLEDNNYEKDYQIWSSIASSLAKWSQRKMDKIKKSQNLLNQTAFSSKRLKRVRR